MHEHPNAAGLARVPLFAGMTHDAREVLAARFEVAEFDVGRRLVAEGRAGFSFYVLVSGRVSVEREGRLLRSMGPGDFFGEIAILGGDGRRTATVTGTEPGVAWTLLADHFHTMQAERPDVADALRTAMQERLAADER